MLSQSLRAVVSRPATRLALSAVPRSSVSTIHPSARTALSIRPYAQRASPLTPRSELQNKDYGGVGLDPEHGTGNAGTRRIDIIMGTLVAIGVVISGWAYFRSASRRANAKKRFEEGKRKTQQIGAGGGAREGETERNKKAI